MLWLRLIFAFLASFAAALGASFLGIAWKRRRKLPESALRIEALLPGHDCGLCSYETCREYALAIDGDRADPALCAPGGAPAAEALRALLIGAENPYGKRADDPRARAMVAIVRCGGTRKTAKSDFEHDNWGDCASAASLYGGPRRCKEGCVGFGSCAKACPLGAIRVREGLAVVDSRLCSGCGDCLAACPKGLVSLVPVEESFYVACSSRMEKGERRSVCSAACDACGECVRHSMRGEFVIADGLARAVSAQGGAWADIAPRCPSGSIRRTEPQKNDDPPFGRSDAKL